MPSYKFQNSSTRGKYRLRRILNKEKSRKKKKYVQWDSSLTEKTKDYSL